MILKTLPKHLEDGKKFLARRSAAANRKEMWRDIYRDAYDYCMPQRETFNWHAPGERKNRHLYDSTGQTACYLAANNMQALLCPPWKQWATLGPSSLLPKEMQESPEVIDQLQDQAEIFFHYLHMSNFDSAIHECLLDIQVGTCAIQFDEGDDDDPFVFDSIPLSAIELEEGPRGTVETEFMLRKPQVRHLTRLYAGLGENDLPGKYKELINNKPETEVTITQGCVYDPQSRKYFGIACTEDGKIFWRYDYGDTTPIIVGRAAVTAGEIYGRGPALMALPDIKTANVVTEYMLRHAALQVAPVLMAVSDGIVNPYTLSLTPNTIVPVMSTESIAPLQIGGDFRLTEVLLDGLHQKIMRMMLGDMFDSEGPVKSATEIALADRNRMWQMGSVYSRIQTELFPKIVKRGVAILAKRGLMQPIRVGGQAVAIKYISPLSRSQAQDEILYTQQAFEFAAATMGPQAIPIGFKTEAIPAWIGKRTGMDADLIRSEQEQKQKIEEAAQAAQQVQEVANESAQ